MCGRGRCTKYVVTREHIEDGQMLPKRIEPLCLEDREGVLERTS